MVGCGRGREKEEKWKRGKKTSRDSLSLLQAKVRESLGLPGGGKRREKGHKLGKQQAQTGDGEEDVE